MIPERTNAHVIAADVREEDWLDAVPTGGLAVIVADGVMAFLSQDELVAVERAREPFPQRRARLQ